MDSMDFLNLAPEPTLNETQVHHVCALIEEITHKLGWHVALTGGSLYKRYPRKDIDIIFYQGSVGEVATREVLIETLCNFQLDLVDQPFSTEPHYAIKGKVKYRGYHYNVDLFFMETSLINAEYEYNTFNSDDLAI